MLNLRSRFQLFYTRAGFTNDHKFVLCIQLTGYKLAIGVYEVGML